MNRIKDKINELNNLIDELKTIISLNMSEYKNDLKTKAACERYFERIVECITDICFLIIKYKKLDIPEDDKQAYDILYKNKLLTKDLCVNLKEAKGMRNILAHEYGKVDDELV
ncbi:MAG: DUF86 domain-containing protein, partial [Nanoarchaeota archaeon]|nr:DUF86 domain-containing protein [Nanoarchaeota archaeon]